MLTVVAETVVPDGATQTINAITTAVPVSTVVAVIGAVVGSGMAFVLMWWAVRKAKNGIMSAVFRGKLRV